MTSRYNERRYLVWPECVFSVIVSHEEAISHDISIYYFSNSKQVVARSSGRIQCWIAAEPPDRVLDPRPLRGGDHRWEVPFARKVVPAGLPLARLFLPSLFSPFKHRPCASDLLYSGTVVLANGPVSADGIAPVSLPGSLCCLSAQVVGRFLTICGSVTYPHSRDGVVLATESNRIDTVPPRRPATDNRTP